MPCQKHGSDQAESILYSLGTWCSLTVWFVLALVTWLSVTACDVQDDFGVNTRPSQTDSAEHAT